MNKKVSVKCSQCDKQWMKEVFDLKKWQGHCKSCAKIGNTIAIGNRGKTKTAEHRAKISNSHMGKPKLHSRGALNYNWRGGVTSEYNKARQSLEYRNWRRQVFERDEYTCVSCGDDKGGNLNADHILPFAFFPKLRFELSNGRTLCVPCHKQTPTYGRKALSYLTN